MQRFRSSFAALLLMHLLFAQVGAFAWGADGHRYINQVAAKRLPHEMPGFFRSAVDRLVYLAPEPDRWRASVEPTLRSGQDPEHFIDMERLEGLGELPIGRWQFVQKLYERRAAASDVKEKEDYLPERVGMQPYAAIEMYERLKAAFRQYRELRKEHKSTKTAELETIYYAGVLGHYVGDASQPLHTTVYYNGWFGDNPHGYTTRKTIHSEFEGDFVARNIKPEDFARQVTTPQRIENPFADYMVFLRRSNGLVSHLYELDTRHAFEEQGTAEGKEFVTQQLAAGSQKLADLWYTAWLESEKQVPPYVAPKPEKNTSPPAPTK